METVSTIGAGDNFNAGFIFGMLKNNITRRDIENGLTEEQWDHIIACAQDFSAAACQSIYNYISKEFGEEKRKQL
jgi:fructokinase